MSFRALLRVLPATFPRAAVAHAAPELNRRRRGRAPYPGNSLPHGARGLPIADNVTDFGTLNSGVGPFARRHRMRDRAAVEAHTCVVAARQHPLPDRQDGPAAHGH
ncbi:hypothetical protein BVI434_880004 [Burkholderia vietnamiensis]|nr:hypothetical protein BVI1335_1410017 [Burkholderia vietnamiensis]CAG9233605.1 hypothetical protein BVI434_880004 [Burkholderia vietnamiensis]